VCSGLQSTTSCGSNNSAMQSTAPQSAVVDRVTVDKKHPMWWHMLSRPGQLKAVAAAGKAVDLLWFVHGLAFNLIGSRLFCDAVEKIKAAPAYKPCHRTTLSTSHLSARNAEANEFKIRRLEHGKQYGFLVTSDGWRNKKRRSYHNFILVAANGPIFLSLKDVTGQAGTAKAVKSYQRRVLRGLRDSRRECLCSHRHWLHRHAFSKCFGLEKSRSCAS
jgi:hypothetical protein